MGKQWFIPDIKSFIQVPFKSSVTFPPNLDYQNSTGSWIPLSQSYLHKKQPETLYQWFSLLQEPIHWQYLLVEMLCKALQLLVPICEMVNTSFLSIVLHSLSNWNCPVYSNGAMRLRTDVPQNIKVFIHLIKIDLPFFAKGVAQAFGM